jgi:hypothetical protein
LGQYDAWAEVIASLPKGYFRCSVPPTEARLNSAEVANLPPGSRQHFAELAASSTTGRPPSLAAVTDPAAMHAYNVVQAHASGQGFLTAAIFALVAVVVSAVMINVKKTDVATSPAEALAPA